MVPLGTARHRLGRRGETRLGEGCTKNIWRGMAWPSWVRQVKAGLRKAGLGRVW